MTELLVIGRTLMQPKPRWSDFREGMLSYFLMWMATEPEKRDA